jgi:hypothetical protein
MHLFAQAARIQREACEASGRYIPMIQENVKGAQPWVGRARWHYGSYYLWGDVPALMPTTVTHAAKGRLHGWTNGSWESDATKNTGGPWFNIGSPGQKVVNRNPTRREANDSFGWSKNSDVRKNSSKSPARKAASARIAKIPFPLAQYIARTFLPNV